MKQGKVIVAFHRYGDVMFGHFVNFDKVIDHQENQVIYFVNARGYEDIAAHRDQAAEVIQFADLADEQAVDAAFAEVMDKYGHVEHVIAMSEFDLITAAGLRTKYGIKGMQESQVLLYRDKVKMKDRLQSDNIRVPKYIEVHSADDIISFANETGFPLILKPKAAAASIGVHRIDSHEQLQELLSTLDLNGYECEEFVEGTIFHIDGLVHEGKLAFISVSRYIGSCLGFAHGYPCGSMLIMDDEELRQLMVNFADASLRSLELANGCFHMEVIYKDEKEPVFLEIGARIGGAEIPVFTQDTFGVNLCNEWIKIELGTFTGLPKLEKKVHGGFLQVPEPPNPPVEVVSVTKLSDVIPEMYGEQIPEPGEVYDGNGLYYHISGRFMYHGESDEQVEKAIRKTVELFKVECKPLESIMS